MAGAGYKLFNTGDVLTAAQVNTYLMEQTVMVFADAAARTAALSGVVSEGMISYLKDTNAVEVYDGSNWVASDDPNAIQNTIVDAKGDLITATAADTPARLAVGNNGETLVADSSASTGLRWQGNFAAGKNKIINGDFAINQRGFTSTTSSGIYTFDRFITAAVDGTSTFSAQTFTTGSAPVAGYEGKNFLQIVSSGQTLASAVTSIAQRIESVRTFAGQTVTVSFWAKANTGTPKVAVELGQNFGAGGSPSAFNPIYLGQVTLSTSWARYSVTGTVTSLSSKTIGTDNSDSLNLQIYTSAGSDRNARTGSLGIQSFTAQMWGIQVEAGNTATAFQTATGTLAGELSLAQRYYQRQLVSGNRFAVGFSSSTTAGKFIVHLPQTMRVAPTAIEYGGTIIWFDGVGGASVGTLTIENPTTVTCGLGFSGSSGLTQYRPIGLSGSSADAYLAFTAEL